ncbi:hypothetical protein CSV63_15405 [Sporosarcina sp. P34]|uniref:pectate lyase-like adhesive domain-containing protein n=1 Tax=Sporosarcina sp. P34 TaxID=2048247 RepID=UPI000C169284|nr:pectate lyase-like adhesive domain-containing protein [Sporosarcina sp. P34]PID13898.1 hypothetical protein CSV63_15405 [Sporosarcina sp. P34]
MKKGFKLSLAAVLATSALTPVAAFAAENDVAANGLYNLATKEFVSVDALSGKTLKEKLALLKNKDVYLATNGVVYKGTDILTKENEELPNSGVQQDVFEKDNGVILTPEGEVVVPGEAVTVESVSAINNNAVTVTFPEVTEAIEDANVVVKDGEGKVVETKPMLLAEGTTQADFEFVTPFPVDHKFTGVWDVNGEKYNFDAINQLADIDEAVKANNEIDLQAALDAAGITYADELRIGKYLEALDADALKSLDAVQKAITKVDEDAATATDKAAAVKAVVDAKTQSQLLSALQANFARVNSAWVVNYSVAGEGALLDFPGTGAGNEATDFTTIQTAIDTTNLAQVAPKVEAANMSLDSKKVAEARELVTKWIPADEEDVTPEKALTLDGLALEDALIAVNNAKTNSALKSALTNLDTLENSLLEKYKDVAGFNKTNDFDIKTVEDANLTAYRTAIFEAEVGAKNQRKDIQKIVTDANEVAVDSAKGKVLADLNKVDSKTSAATVVALLEKSQEVHADDLKAAEATVNKVNTAYAEAYKTAALAADTGLVGETAPTAEEVNDLIGDVNKAQDALNGIVDTKEELLAALTEAAKEDSKLKTITLEKSIEVDNNTIVLTSGVTIDGNNHTLYVGGTAGDAGSTTAEGLSVAKGAKDVVIKNLEVRGTHGDNLVEIYGSATLDNVIVIGGKKAGIYVNNDGTDTITVNFKDITTGGNAWDAGIGLISQNIGSKVVANFSGTNSFGESVAVYTDDVNKYKGQYEVNGLDGYKKDLVVDKNQDGSVKQTQWKWTKIVK